MPALLLLLSKIKLIHWALIGAIIFGLSMLTYSKVLKTRLSASQTHYRAFVANVETEGYKQQAKNWQERQTRDKITQELELKHVETKNDRDRKYAEYRRLHNSRTNSSNLPLVPISPECRESGQEAAIVTRTMGDIRERILGILEQGDKGIEAAVIHEDWEEEQTKVLIK